jgi:GT2 family glycosyltransferase
MIEVDLAIITFNRPDEVLRAVESGREVGFRNIFVLDNGSNSPIQPIQGVEFIRSEENLGVCGGRNLLLRSSDSKFVLFLDDDAELYRPCDLNTLVSCFESDDQLSVLAGRVIRADGSIRPHEFPFRRVRRTTFPRRCGYFVGACFMVDRQLVVDAGGFDDSFFYGHEETDLSLRLAKRALWVQYNPQLQAIHSPSESGRSPSIQSLARQLRNRLILSRRSLPLLPRLVHQITWITFYLVKAIRHDKTGTGDIYRVVKESCGSNRPRIATERLPLGTSIGLHFRGYRIFW